jgi:hypothetical protein
MNLDPKKYYVKIWMDDKEMEFQNINIHTLYELLIRSMINSKKVRWEGYSNDEGSGCRHENSPRCPDPS